MTQSIGRPRAILAASAALLAAAALVGCSTAAPAESAPVAAADAGRAPAVQDPVTTTPAEVSAATPERVRIPAIDVDAALQDLGTGGDGELLPPDGLEDAGWFTNGAVPGRVGPAVLAGHVDVWDEVAVFHRLAELQTGDRIEVAMSDGSTVAYAVDRVERHPKAAFPTKAVYGPTPDAQLRVITCGGDFDDAAASYLDNDVVFATLVA